MFFIDGEVGMLKSSVLEAPGMFVSSLEGSSSNAHTASSQSNRAEPGRTSILPTRKTIATLHPTRASDRLPGMARVT